QTLMFSVAPVSLKIAPPPMPPWARLPVRAQWSRVSVPKLSMPAPWVAVPSAMVRPVTEAVTPPETPRTRSAWLPLTVSRADPGPVTVRSSVIVICPVVSLMVPLTPELNAITSAPGFALASRMAWRNDPAPASRRLETVYVLGNARSSNSSSRGTKDLTGVAVRRESFRESFGRRQRRQEGKAISEVFQQRSGPCCEGALASRRTDQTRGRRED